MRMKGSTLFSGLAGLAVLVVATVTGTLLANVPFYFVPIHFVLAAGLLAFFFFSGGLQSLRRRAGGRSLLSAEPLLILAVFFLTGALNWFVLKNDPLYYDSTEQKVFTIAPQTKTVLEKLNGRVLVRAFFLGGEIDHKLSDLLERMAQSSPDFRWQLVNADKEVALVKKLGIEQAGTLHFEYTSDALTRTGKLTHDLTEQEIVNALLKLSRGGEAKKICYLQGHGEPDFANLSEVGYSLLKEAIEAENLKMEPLEIGAAGVPQECAVLLLVSPKRKLLTREFEALEQYLENYGNALFLADPQASDDMAGLARRMGIEIGADAIIDIEFSSKRLGLQPMVTSYARHPATGNFKEGTIYSIACSVRAMPVPIPNVHVSEIAQTSSTSWAERDLERLFGPAHNAELNDTDLKGPVSIAAAAEKLENDDPRKRRSRMVVIGDSDFLANINIRQLYNRDFFLNAVNWVVGFDEGVTIREKTMRHSQKVIPQSSFAAIFQLTAIVVPELIVLAGLFIYSFRR